MACSPAATVPPNIARARQLLGAAPRVVEPKEEKVAAPDEPRVLPCPCPRCGARFPLVLLRPIPGSRHTPSYLQRLFPSAGCLRPPPRSRSCLLGPAQSSTA